jgi:hypothetical protein
MGDHRRLVVSGGIDSDLYLIVSENNDRNTEQQNHDVD